MFDVGKGSPSRAEHAKAKQLWLAITLTGACQQGSVVPSAAVIIVATLFKAIAHAIWCSLPQLWRDQLVPSRAGIIEPLRKSPAKIQERHHAYQ
jgi:hypothetical protein